MVEVGLCIAEKERKIAACDFLTKSARLPSGQ